MTNWNKLLTAFDDLFSHGAKQQSRITQKVQGFDNQTGERVIRIEYRVKLLNEGKYELIRAANDQLKGTD